MIGQIPKFTVSGASGLNFECAHGAPWRSAPNPAPLLSGTFTRKNY
jgi:hypothetical protein